MNSIEGEHRKIALSIVIFLTTFITSFSQTIVKGTVRDAVTKQPLQSVSVIFKSGKGVTTDQAGNYTITSANSANSAIIVSYVGYKTQTQSITPNKEQVVDIELQVADSKNTVVVHSKRGKYSNKNNPAVELIRKVIDNKINNKVTSYNYVQYEQYEKVELSLTNKPEKVTNSKLLKNFQFVFDNRDSSKIEGKSLLPVYLEERLSQKYYRRKPEKEKTYILGEKKVNYGEYVDQQGISSFLKRLYEDVDIYQNNISLLTNQFISPIADLAPTFYRFYITDTVETDGIKLVRLSFAPKNPADLVFKGTMFVTLDGNYSVQKINMSISKNANLNWVRDLRIKQDFQKGPDGRYHVISTNTITEFALTKGASGGIMGERTVSLKNFAINNAVGDSMYAGDAVVTVTNKANNSDSFWIAHRHPQLSTVEAKVYTNIDSLQNMKSYKRLMDYGTLLLAGYKSAGRGYEIGPANAFYSFNPVEGFRLRFGGRTTPVFNNTLYFENYVAYGFKDEKWKYFLAGTYSFNHKSVYGYPLNYLKLSYQRDTKIPGQELQFVQEDNFLLSFKRGNNDKWLYNDIFKAEYVREFPKNVSVTLAFKNWKQTPAGTITYNKLAEGSRTFDNIPNVTTSEVSTELRWAPHEQFYQGKVYRTPIINKYPIFRLRFIAGIDGLMNGQYNYQNVNLNIYKRFYLSQLGYTDISVEGGNIFGKVPFPLLTIHRANQTYAYMQNSYNMMNFMEFVSDHYAALNADHYFNGFFFNKVPLLKKLKLREVVTGKLLYGGLRDENNPDKNNSTFKFPIDNATGLPTTYSLNKQPYAEISVGVGNIFKLLRVDLVKRLTYLDHPNTTQWGIRTLIKFDF